MTMRDVAIQAMKELSWTEYRIRQVLEYMDKEDPENTAKSIRVTVKPEHERTVIEKAKSYMSRHNTLPIDN